MLREFLISIEVFGVFDIGKLQKSQKKKKTYKKSQKNDLKYTFFFETTHFFAVNDF